MSGEGEGGWAPNTTELTPPLYHHQAAATREYFQFVASHFANARLVVVPGAGHFVPQVSGMHQGGRPLVRDRGRSLGDRTKGKGNERRGGRTSEPTHPRTTTQPNPTDRPRRTSRPTWLGRSRGAARSWRGRGRPASAGSEWGCWSIGVSMRLCAMPYACVRVCTCVLRPLGQKHARTHMRAQRLCACALCYMYKGN